MRLLLEAEVVAHAVFDPSVGTAHLRLPEKNVELRLKNLSVEPGTEKPLMEALLVFEAESLETGLKPGRRLLRELLSALSYVTSFKYEYHRTIRLIDWSEGNFARRYHQYQSFPGHELPQYVLTPDILESAGAIWAAAKGHPMEVAVHWFSSGVKATALEDQFQLFWFSAELCAEYGKDKEEVNDRCTTCQNPLYCETCKTHPTHRPFPKQAIEQMFNAILGKRSKEVSPRLFKVRNLLMHGATRDQIEKEIGGEMIESVEDIAQITKRALFHLLKNELAKGREGQEFPMLMMEGYVHLLFSMQAVVESSSIPPDMDMLDRLAKPEISMVYRSEEAAKTKTASHPHAPMPAPKK